MGRLVSGSHLRIVLGVGAGLLSVVLAVWTSIEAWVSSEWGTQVVGAATAALAALIAGTLLSSRRWVLLLAATFLAWTAFKVWRSRYNNGADDYLDTILPMFFLVPAAVPILLVSLMNATRLRSSEAKSR